MEESIEYPSDSEIGESLRPAMHVIPLLDASQSLHVETAAKTNVSVHAEVDVNELEPSEEHCSVTTVAALRDVLPKRLRLEPKTEELLQFLDQLSEQDLPQCPTCSYAGAVEFEELLCAVLGVLLCSDAMVMPLLTKQGCGRRMHKAIATKPLPELDRFLDMLPERQPIPVEWFKGVFSDLASPRRAMQVCFINGETLDVSMCADATVDDVEKHVRRHCRILPSAPVAILLVDGTSPLLPGMCLPPQERPLTAVRVPQPCPLERILAARDNDEQPLPRTVAELGTALKPDLFAVVEDLLTFLADLPVARHGGDAALEFGTLLNTAVDIIRNLPRVVVLAETISDLSMRLADSVLTVLTEAQELEEGPMEMIGRLQRLFGWLLL